MTDGGGGGDDAASTFYFSASTRRDAECSAVNVGADGQFCASVGAPRVDMTEFMGLAEKVNKFNQQALKHIENQTLNPFSGRFSRSPSPRPKFNKDEYGKPAAGSLTEIRGQRAFSQISREIMELCEVIHDMGARRRDSDGDECIIIPFGELFAFYTKISDKVVGLLIAAKKRGFVYFEPEILFQRRDDDVLIALLKPIAEIRNIVNRQISASPSPAPPASSESDKTSRCTTPSPLAQRENSAQPEVSPSPADAKNPTSLPTPITSVEKEQPTSSCTTQDAPQQTPTVPETDKISSSEVKLLPVEEEPVSTSEAPIVESKQAPSSEGPDEAEKTLPVTTTETPVVDEGNSPIESSLSSDGLATSLSTAPSETEPISQPTEPIVPTEEENTLVELNSASEDQISPKPSEEQVSTSFSEEQISLKPSEKEDELTLTIIVESEHPSATTTEIQELIPSNSEVEQTNSSSEAQTPENSSENSLSSIVQISRDGNEQTTEVIAESDQTLAAGDKKVEIAPTNENEQAPPSNDTGEKTLA